MLYKAEDNGAENCIHFNLAFLGVTRFSNFLYLKLKKNMNILNVKWYFVQGYGCLYYSA